MNLTRKLFPKFYQTAFRAKLGISLSVVLIAGCIGLGNGNIDRAYNALRAKPQVAAVQTQLPRGEITKVVFTQPAVVEPTPEPETPALLQQRCIAHTVDGEAGGEGFEGKLAVAYVAFNRYTKSGSTPCTEVCKAGQFDGATKACDGRVKSMRPSDEAMDITYKVMTGEYKAEGCLARALYFMNPITSSEKGAMWILKNATFCTVIGNHAFFEPKVQVQKPVVAHAKKKPAVVANAKVTSPASSKPIKLAANDSKKKK